MGRRRGQREGYLYIKSGSWILRWREDSRDITGRATRDQRSMVIAKAEGPAKIGRRAAERLAWDLVLSRLDTISQNPAALITFKDFVTQRFEPDHMWGLKPTGQEHYKYMLSSHVLPFLGGYRLRDITPIVIQNFFRTKRDGYAGQTLKHMKNVISAVLRHAKRLQMFSGDLPTDAVMLPPVNAKERTALTASQAAQLVARMPGQYGVLATLLLTTGLRIGEAAGLRWRRIDFAAGTLKVAENYTHGKWTTPKTEKSVRTVPVPAAVLTAIAGLRGDAGPDDPVFMTTHGNPVDARTTAAKFLKPAAKACGVPWVSWHSFRHTNATLAEASGMSSAGRQKLLGHASEAMALHYTHPEMETARAAVEGIAAALMLPGGKSRSVN
jgi:integrase